ncbi:MaoC family dehydratase [Emticicia agri]|uniref:MaoC family dehydratase n=1 Tax=Emticicia agri TaxID=2492393 RepID=A0A4V1ZCT3_9BACT|nr:MaoC family dehydratase [Emticicia agri]RYU93760.1 MaoC family dehydratase [Emticicia agri]
MLLEIGDTYKYEFRFSQEDVQKFAEVTGDKNPLHLDPEYAAKTRFKRPIIHGHLSSSVFTRILGMEFPGEGSVYMKQETEYLFPMFVDTDYEVVFTVMTVDREKHMAQITGEVFIKGTSRRTIRGLATLMHPEKI